MANCNCGFCHLHVHSEYSLLDGANRIKDLARRAAEMEMPALALTDHGVMYGAIDHYLACQEHGIKPIIGVETYVAPRKHTDKDPQLDSQKKTNHLTLWAKNETGYKNMVKLITQANLHGFYYKPRVDHELLAQYSEGIICGSACLGGEIPQLIMGQKFNEAVTRAEKYREIFGPENFFLELMDHDLHGQAEVNEKIVSVHHKTGIPLIATNDAHFLRASDEQMHKIMVCIGTNTTLDKVALHYGPNFYLKSQNEMFERFKHVPEALENTLRIADMVDLQLDLKTTHFPNFEVPAGHDLISFLRQLCKQRFPLRYPPGHPRHDEATKRMEYELGIIIQKGYAGYFLVVQDFINWSKERGILVGCRGSAAGCLVSYVLGITNLDPLPYGLLFERFLNPDRVSTPDIDVDFPDKRRDEVMQYVTNKYGKEKVAQIITFGTLAARAAVRDTARAMGVDLKIADSVAKLIPAIPGHPVSIKQAIEQVKELGDMYANNTEIRDLCDAAQQIEGFTRHASRHACGVVIGKDRLDDLVPLEEKDGDVITQYHAKAVEKIGLVKMDFLGLQNNTVINDTLDLIKQRRGEDIDLETIDLNDKKVYDMLGKGDGVAVFQMEGVGMRNLLRELKPENLEHIIAQISLYRPGPMEEIPRYISGRYGGKVTYPHPKLKEVLKDTYGMLLYQEQVMQASQVLAGFTGGQAETLMKAMSKKKKEDMAKLKPLFLEGCGQGGIDQATAEDIFGRMEEFAKYAFNKCCHAQTKVTLPDGRRMTLAQAYREQPAEIMAMWPDGEIKPHRIQRIVRTGTKPLLKVTTASGKVIKATAEHRLLTTGGYQRIDEMAVGTELMVAPRVMWNLTERGREARRQNMRRVNAHPERGKWAQETSVRMKQYQAARPLEDKVAHMKRMHVQYPDMTRAAVAAMHDRIKWLYANDPEWRRNQIERSITHVRDCYNTGPGFGRCSIASNGMWCASQAERNMAEWLIEQEVDFAMHKVLPNGRICDFYFAGVYWEMDGMDRIGEYFAQKYSDLPYVVVTPEDFKPIVEHHLQLAHAQNGDPIVKIEPCQEAITYDVEMAPDGPLNYIANGIVSHNSHAAYYGLVSYWTAYLKTNYAPEFMACKMTSLLEKKDKLLVVIDDCRKHGIEVLPPDVNESNHEFTVVGQNDDAAIRFGLQAIKGIGEAPVNAIIDARRTGGKFISLFDFCERVAPRACGKGAIETLIKCGAFDSIHNNRQAMMETVDNAIRSAELALKEAGQGGLFESGPTMGQPKSTGQMSDVADADRDVRLAWEKELLGLYISDHPLLPLRHYLEQNATPIERITGDPSLSDGSKITVGGMVTMVKKMVDKNGRTWAAFTIEDLTGSIEILTFSKTYDKCGECAEEDAKILVTGRLTADSGRGGGRQQNNDEEGGGTESEAIRYKIMADSIEPIAVQEAMTVIAAEPIAEALGEMPADVVVAPFTDAPPAVTNGNGVYRNGTNGNGANGNGSNNGAPGISINRSVAGSNGANGSGSNGNGYNNGSNGNGTNGSDEGRPMTPRIGRGFAPPQWAGHCVHLHIADDAATPEILNRLWTICRTYQGDTEVWLHLDNGEETVQLRVSPSYWVDASPDFCDEIAHILGESHLMLPEFMH